MITIKATLHMYDDIRKTPFSNGYRPAFDFGTESLTSGRIMLLDNKKQLFYPGEIGEVEISFMFEEFVKDKLKIGEKIYFYEGSNCLGEIKILEISNN
ncbi:MAG: hypothetical protein MUW56_17440 [Chryseobacterium sp.]|uniref:hypothetical protein n=1 Tax=Chryseobacterium sp. TaxID=1871047 RepID=UPI0025C63E1C|nr:hypothetical protein [Chryseobacterium sp.]MCJ7935356.1 hypothetical protein [Chryseobacterium sp.]